MNRILAMLLESLGTAKPPQPRWFSPARPAPASPARSSMSREPLPDTYAPRPDPYGILQPGTMKVQGSYQQRAPGVHGPEYGAVDLGGGRFGQGPGGAYPTGMRNTPNGVFGGGLAQGPGGSIPMGLRAGALPAGSVASIVNSINTPRINAALAPLRTMPGPSVVQGACGAGG